MSEALTRVLADGDLRARLGAAGMAWAARFRWDDCGRRSLDALRGTVHWLLDAYGLSAASVGGHRDYAPTACPGANLYARLADMLA